MKNSKKIIQLASISISLSLISANSAKALTYSFPYATVNTTDIYREIESRYNKDSYWYETTEERYGFDEDIWRKSKRKSEAPRVEIFFDNTNPKPGEKVTANAIPEYFKNDPHNLYYTWYLIHTTDGTPRTATNTIDEGKREAAKIIARGDYDPELENQYYNYDQDKDNDDDGWPSIDKPTHDEDIDIAPFGGADGKGGLTDNEKEPYSSGDEACKAKGTLSFNECSINNESAYIPLSTYYILKSNQNNYWCNSCQTYFSANPSLLPSSSALSERNQCCYNAIPQSELQCDDGSGGFIKCPYSSTTDYCGTSYRSIFDKCYANFANSNKSTIENCLSSNFSSCSSSWTSKHTSFNEEIYIGVTRCYKHNFGVGRGASQFLDDDESGMDYPVSCKHKWPDADKFTSGSGKFTNGEEKYWKTDPNDPDTDGDGFVDEADIIGLGQQSFSWNYQPGDRVGVVVEGTSMIPTDEKTAYYKIMWGYPDVCDSTKTGLMKHDACEGSDDYGFGFYATKAPNEGTSEKIDINLSYTPENPIADSSNQNSEYISNDGSILNADVISVQSSISNYNESDLFYYHWQISRGDLKKDEWYPMDLNNFDTSIPSGIGINSFSFSPKKQALSGSSDITYFKVTLTVSKTSNTNSKRGRSSIIIPVNRNGVQLVFKKVDISGGKAVVGKEICNGRDNAGNLVEADLYKILCPAVKGQIMVAEIKSAKYNDAEISWNLNGQQYVLPPNASSFISGWTNNTVFFPITAEPGEVEQISVTVIPKNEFQPVSNTRLITVVKPMAVIEPTGPSEIWKKSYIVPNENKRGDFVEVVAPNTYEFLAQESLSFTSKLIPDYLLQNDEKNTEINWLVNKVSVHSTDFYEKNEMLYNLALKDNEQNLSFDSLANPGDSFVIETELKKYWSDDEKNILYNVWGIIPETQKGQNEVELIATDYNPKNDLSKKEQVSKQILAAVSTNLPENIIFLFRLLISTTVMLMGSMIIYSISQNAVKGKNY